MQKWIWIEQSLSQAHTLLFTDLNLGLAEMAFPDLMSNLFNLIRKAGSNWGHWAVVRIRLTFKQNKTKQKSVYGQDSKKNSCEKYLHLRLIWQTKDSYLLRVHFDWQENHETS